jgi:hypothetical protein
MPVGFSLPQLLRNARGDRLLNHALLIATAYQVALSLGFGHSLPIAFSLERDCYSPPQTNTWKLHHT